MLRNCEWAPELNKPGIYEVQVIGVISIKHYRKTLIPHKGILLVDYEGLCYRLSLHRISVDNIYTEQLLRKLPNTFLERLEGLRREKILVGIGDDGASYTGIHALLEEVSKWYN